MSSKAKPDKGALFFYLFMLKWRVFMKVTVFSMREFDEKPLFMDYSKEMDIVLTITKEAPSMENLRMVKGSQCISIVTTPVDEKMLHKLKELGVKFISTRTIGYDHIDINAAKKIGIQIANAPYDPQGVADYTVMLMLMSIRKIKCIMDRANIQDFTLKGIQGREISDFTIGVIGTGRIGRKVIQYLSGFGCKILAYDVHESDEIKKYAQYTELDFLYKEADLITLHLPLTEKNFHMINKESIGKMKDHVIIINTARGGLIDSTALIEGLERGKIGGAGLDVIENEFSLYYYDRRSEVLENRELSILKAFPNVIVTPHMAFYTDNYVRTVVRDSLRSCKAFVHRTDNPWIIPV